MPKKNNDKNVKLQDKFTERLKEIIFNSRKVNDQTNQDHHNGLTTQTDNSTNPRQNQSKISKIKRYLFRKRDTVVDIKTLENEDPALKKEKLVNENKDSALKKEKPVNENKDQILKKEKPAPKKEEFIDKQEEAVMELIRDKFQELEKGIPSTTNKYKINAFKQDFEDRLMIYDISEPEVKLLAIQELLGEVKKFAKKPDNEYWQNQEDKDLYVLKQNLLKEVKTAKSMLENVYSIDKQDLKNISNLKNENYKVNESAAPSEVKIKPKLNVDDQNKFNKIINSNQHSKDAMTISDSSSSMPPPKKQKRIKANNNISHSR